MGVRIQGIYQVSSEEGLAIQNAILALLDSDRTYIPVNQASAGTTVLAVASPGNKHKIVGAVLSITADGSIKFSDGSGDLVGPSPISATGGFVMPTSIIPYQKTAVNSALNLVTTGGAARGVVIIQTEP